MTEQDHVNGRTPLPWTTKINPLWLLRSDDTWTAPEINNYEPYLPGVTNQFLRNVMWWFRNPMGNFVGYALGVQDKNYTVTGSAPVMAVTLADATPPRTGWKWSIINAPMSYIWLIKWVVYALLCLFSLWFMVPALFSLFRGFGFLPFVSYYGVCEFYIGWRPHSGAFGFKLVNASRGEN